MDDILRLNAAALRVLAHPLRSRLLTQLRMNGPSTATDLANRLTTNTGATSYHLRKLESVGLVSDTGTGAGKRRVWRASTRGHEWTTSEFAGNADAQASLEWLSRHYMSQLGEWTEQWFLAQHGWPKEWRDALGYNDDSVLVTAEQAAALQNELYAVLRRYRDVGAGDPSARQVLISAVLVPAHPGYEAEPT